MLSHHIHCLSVCLWTVGFEPSLEGRFYKTWNLQFWFRHKIALSLANFCQNAAHRNAWCPWTPWYSLLFVMLFWVFADMQKNALWTPHVYPSFRLSVPFSLIIKLIWTRFKGMVPLDHRAPHFQSYLKILLLWSVTYNTGFVVFLFIGSIRRSLVSKNVLIHVSSLLHSPLYYIYGLIFEKWLEA